MLIRNDANGCLPRFRYTDIKHHVDAQTNLPYNIALAAHRVEVGAAWQNESNINSPSVRAFMQKVSFEPYPRADEARHQELAVEGRAFLERRPSFVQVAARGRLFTETAEYAKWLAVENSDFRATDDDLAAKFRANATSALGSAKVEKAINKVMNLDALEDVSELMEELAP